MTTGNLEVSYRFWMLRLHGDLDYTASLFIFKSKVTIEIYVSMTFGVDNA